MQHRNSLITKFIINNQKNWLMKKISFYEAPTIETIDCAVEQGFAATGDILYSDTDNTPSWGQTDKENDMGNW